MSNEGIALLVIYVFAVFTIILPLLLTLISAHLSYVGIINVYAVIHEYINAIISAAILLIIGAVLIYKYSSSLARGLVSDVIRVYETHGIFDVFTHRRLIQLYLLLLIPAVIVYLINAGITKAVNTYGMELSIAPHPLVVHSI
ncbi:hypothetical protein [Vulcanisaeta distributa]|uniref:hypothetical protein n=1 Tax=Vulcanisaeta distributa TaxID=164451 RepID=UPI0006D20538|nr:hypothetical protein [Vulcanisaeta distributa]